MKQNRFDFAGYELHRPLGRAVNKILYEPYREFEDFVTSKNYKISKFPEQ